jgi:uncharacterized membrane protein
MRGGQWALGLGIWVWLVALSLAPPMLMPVGALICHQRAERSFFLDSRQMPVCARCTGLYAGAAFAVPLALVAAASIASNRARTLALAASLPTVITWSLEFTGVAHFSNATRFAAALPLGGTAAWLVLGVLAEGTRGTTPASHLPSALRRASDILRRRH